MLADTCWTNLARRDWLRDGPIDGFVANYIESLRHERYSEHTIRAYLGCLAHFSHWISSEGLTFTRLDSSLINRFLREHLPVCKCPGPCYRGRASSGAALRHLLRALPSEQAPVVASDPVMIEVQRFADYLTSTCGYAPATCERRVHYVGDFLAHAFGSQAPVISALSVSHLDAFFADRCAHLQPASLRIVCNCLRSYFRYRALAGDQTTSLAAALPRIADWRRTTLPKVLSDAELDALLKAFDGTDPVRLRDYAIARCLIDLGLRGHEVTYLTLESVNWRSATLTICSTKSKRVQQLPLPASTGEAIAQYLRNGRPQTENRALFVRHRAPFDKPLGVPAIRNAMNRAFVRCGLRDRFCNTHVLRRTMATRLQRSGSSIKEIADLLRHQGLDTASTYARLDLERLRSVARPWPGRQP